MTSKLCKCGHEEYLHRTMLRPLCRNCSCKSFTSQDDVNKDNPKPLSSHISNFPPEYDNGDTYILTDVLKQTLKRVIERKICIYCRNYATPISIAHCHKSSNGIHTWAVKEVDLKEEMGDDLV